MGCGTSKPNVMVATPIPHAKKPHSSSTVKKDANTREIGSLLTNDSQHQSKDKAAKLQAIKEMFEKYDKDNDGGISMKEFKEMSHSLGLYINSTLRFNIDNVAATQMRIFQINGKKLEFKNFMEWYNTDPACKEMEFSPEDMVLVDQIHEHFNAFDKDGSGIIDSIEFNRFYDDLLAKGLTQKSKYQTLRELDTDRDGIKFHEYVWWHFRK